VIPYPLHHIKGYCEAIIILEESDDRVETAQEILAVVERLIAEDEA